MRLDVRAAYVEALEESHLGYPSVTSTVQSGNRGRPRIVFDPQLSCLGLQPSVNYSPGQGF